MKTLVYETKVDSRTAQRDCIFATTEHICNHPDKGFSAIESLQLRMVSYGCENRSLTLRDESREGCLRIERSEEHLPIRGMS